jgi:hypothetical protein
VRLLAVSEAGSAEPDDAELIRRLKLIEGVRIGAGGKPLGASRPVRQAAGQKTFAAIVLEDRR